MILSETEKNYIAGFLEGDGCINACTNHQTLTTSLSSNRVYIGFYQKTTTGFYYGCKRNRYGFVRKRKGMPVYYYWPRSGQNLKRNGTCYTEKPQLKLVLKIIKELPKAKDQQTFLRCESVAF